VAAAGSAPKQAYSRVEVRRVLGISEQQIRSWEKQSFVDCLESYTFSDLLALKTLVALRRSSVPALRIRRALAVLREQLKDGGNPLTELKLYSEGKKIRVQFADAKWEPISGQLLLDFDKAEIEKLRSFPRAKDTSQASGSKIQRRAEAEHWFERGLQLEQAGAAMTEIVAAYEKAIELDPNSAGAYVNLGTVYFNARAMKDAERLYSKAVEVDPNYALAHFNLGNLHDENGDREQALYHYVAALGTHPDYADAHYNIALLYQSMGQSLKAVHHWKAYLKLDSGSSWAAIARRELEKLRESTIVRGRE